MKKGIWTVALIGLLLAAGFILIGCKEKDNCPGNGECTVTIKQDNGLSVDYDSPRSSCGKSRTYNSSTSTYNSGCKVQENIDGDNRTYGTHGCGC